MRKAFDDRKQKRTIALEEIESLNDSEKTQRFSARVLCCVALRGRKMRALGEIVTYEYVRVRKS